MTPRELAEKIFDISYSMYSERSDQMKATLEIEALLTEFHDDIVLEFGKRYQNQRDECMASARKEILIAVAQEREACSEIAENHNGCVDVKCLTESNCGATIAAQIRARGTHD